MQEILNKWCDYLNMMFSEVTYYANRTKLIADYFYRVEFQQRGIIGLHIPGLFWVEDAPQYGKSSEEEIAD